MSYVYACTCDTYVYAYVCDIYVYVYVCDILPNSMMNDVVPKVSESPWDSWVSAGAVSPLIVVSSCRCFRSNTLFPWMMMVAWNSIDASVSMMMSAR